MRTTVDLAPDLIATLRRLAQERGSSLSDVINTALRRGLTTEARAARSYRLKTRRMGLRPGIDLTRALSLTASLEDEELVRKLELRK